MSLSQAPSVSAASGQFTRGLQRALPIVLSYIPVGFTYGVIANKAGISDFNVILMSILVFAGSAQFIAVGMIAGGTGFLPIILTTFVVNLRHLLMSASLSTWMSNWSKPLLTLFSYEITDETFAMNSALGEELNVRKTEAFTVNAISHFSWVFGSILGLFASSLITDIKPFGLDFALPGMFIGLIVLQVNTLAKLVTAICAAVLGTILFYLGIQQFYIIIATVIAATFGLCFELWIKR